MAVFWPPLANHRMNKHNCKTNYIKDMKKLLLLLPISLFLACGTDRESGTATLVLENQLDIERIDELVVIDRGSLEKRLGEINEGQVVIVSSNGNPVPSQIDDIDLDGQWDELAFVHNFAPNQKVELSLRVVPSTELPEFEKRTNIHFAKVIVRGEKYEGLTSAVRIKGTETKITQQHFQYEGPGWENDKVGFRNYFDERNGMDIWGKTTTDMVLDRVGIKDNYHVMQPWGMDILRVGNSLGAGALAIQYNDSLYRVTAPEGATYQLVSEGPARSVFNLDFDQITINGKSFSLKHQITIVAGEYGYRSNVTLKNAPSGIRIVTGIVNIQTDNMYKLDAGGAHVVYSHDLQSFDDEYLGMAVMTASNSFKEAFATPDTGEGITQTFAVSMEPDNNHHAEFLFYSCWEKSDASFANKGYFEQFLYNEATRYANPVKVDFR
jgi:hypothetical protein